MSCNEWKETEIGLIPIDWEVKMIGEIGKVIGGGTPNTRESKYWDGNISWITPKDLSGYNERYIYKGERSITKEGLENSSARLLPKGTVLFSSRAPIGYVAIAGKDLTTNQGFKSIICNDEMTCNMFVYYLMKYKKEEIEQIANGSTFKEVSGKVLNEFKIALPPLNEQKAIAKILSDLDEKIEINNRINKILEEIAQAIFKRWFVEFEFLNENGEPYKSSGGEFVDSELGPIPKGWQVGILEDIIEIHDSKRIPLSSMQRNKMKKIYPYYGAAGIIDYVDNYIFDGKYVLMGEDGTVIDSRGYPIVQYVCGKFWANNHTHVLKAKGGFTIEYLYILLKNTIVKHIVTGAVQPKINQENLRKLKIIKPNDNRIIKLYMDILENIFLKKICLENQILSLSQLRNTLLPKLISGEIRVELNNGQIVLKNED